MRCFMTFFCPLVTLREGHLKRRKSRVQPAFSSERQQLVPPAQLSLPRHCRNGYLILLSLLQDLINLQIHWQISLGRTDRVCTLLSFLECCLGRTNKNVHWSKMYSGETNFSLHWHHCTTGKSFRFYKQICRIS